MCASCRSDCCCRPCYCVRRLLRRQRFGGSSRDCMHPPAQETSKGKRKRERERLSHLLLPVSRPAFSLSLSLSRSFSLFFSLRRTAKTSLRSTCAFSSLLFSALSRCIERKRAKQSEKEKREKRWRRGEEGDQREGREGKEESGPHSQSVGRVSRPVTRRIYNEILFESRRRRRPATDRRASFIR